MAVIAYIGFFVFLIYLNLCSTGGVKDVIKLENFVFWPNATIPFYIEPKHYDSEQSLEIMTSLSLFAFKTCLQFKPVLVAPKSSTHAMVFENPLGVRKCIISRQGHSINELHRLTVGFECMQSPQIDMLVMKALGFPFEHNRLNRDKYIDVQFENIEAGAIELFTKEAILPPELRALPYDVNSVMHFDDRLYSKNGHRTFIFKDSIIKQHRIGLSAIDLQKIDIVYGSECKKRDRQAKLDICKTYPQPKRRKRDISSGEVADTTVQNLRINRDITPPADNATDENGASTDLGIDEDIENILEQIHNISAIALNKVKNKHCNSTNNTTIKICHSDMSPFDTKKIVEHITSYVRANVDNAISNLTLFCNTEMKCAQRCRDNIWRPRSTKTGPVLHFTQHRPINHQPTRSEYNRRHVAYGVRSNNPSDRRKREVDSNSKIDIDIKDETGETLVIPESSNTGSATQTKTNISDILKNGTLRRHIEKYSGNSNEDKLVLSSNEKYWKYQKLDKGKNIFTIGNNLYKKRDRFKKERQLNENYGGMDGKGRDIYKDQEDIREIKWEKEIDVENENENLSNTERYRYKEKVSEEESDSQRDAEDDQLSEDDNNKYEVREELSVTRTTQKLRKISKLTELQEDTKRNKLIHDRNKLRDKHQRETTSKLPRVVPLSEENKEFYKDRTWPDGVVPYVLKDLPQYNMEAVRTALNQVNEILDKYTCVKLEEVTKVEDQEDYLVLDTSSDFVTGRVGGKQQFGVLELYQGGQHRQYAAMIVMSMLGFYFELARHDRDDNVRVHVRHIRPDKLHHFEKLPLDATLPLPYDYKSATHPAWQFWRRIGKTGISTVATYKDKDRDGTVMKSLGQNERLLSKIDLIKINSVYGTDCFADGQSDDNK